MGHHEAGLQMEIYTNSTMVDSTNNSTNNSTILESPANAYTIILWTQIPIATAIIVGNLLTLAAITKTKKIQISLRILFGNMAITDTMVGLVFLFNCMILILNHQHSLSVAICAIRYGILYISIFVSIINVSLMSLDRCLTINFPFRYLAWMNARKATIATAITWVFAVLLAIVCWYRPLRNLEVCMFMKMVRVETLIIPGIFTFMHSIVIIVCYMFIVKEVLRHANNIMPIAANIRARPVGNVAKNKIAPWVSSTTGSTNISSGNCPSVKPVPVGVCKSESANVATPDEIGQNGPKTTPEEIEQNGPKTTPEEIGQNGPKTTPEEIGQNGHKTTPEEIGQNGPKTTPDEIGQNGPKTPEEIGQNGPQTTPDEIGQNGPKTTPEEIGQNRPKTTPEEIGQNGSKTTPEEIGQNGPQTTPHITSAASNLALQAWRASTCQEATSQAVRSQGEPPKASLPPAAMFRGARAISPAAMVCGAPGRMASTIAPPSFPKMKWKYMTATKTVTTILGAFMCFNMPNIILLLHAANHEGMRERDEYYPWGNFTLFFMIMNSLANPIIYQWKMKQIRAGLLKFFCQAKCQKRIRELQNTD